MFIRRSLDICLLLYFSAFYGSKAVNAENLAFQVLYQKNGTDSSENFGYSVAGGIDVNGDGVCDFIVGAPGASPGGLVYAGSVFVYSGFDGSLLYQKNGSAAGDLFGFSVAGVGDVNGDGRADFIVGAPNANAGGGAYAGSAYVYSGLDGSLLFQKDGFEVYANVGYSVAGAGDVNGDGKADFVVGAPSSLGFAGSAFVYSGSDGTLLFQKNASGNPYSYLGWSVAGVGDVNGDGRADLIVGAPSQATPGAHGSALIYSGRDSSLLFQRDGPTVQSRLGNSVAGAGDLDNDGRADFIVGTPLASPGGLSEAGSVFVYSGLSGSLLFQKDGSKAGDWFGYSVAGAGDVNGDGRADFIVGALVCNPGGISFTGSVFVYSGLDGSLLFQKDGSQADDQVGFSVAGAGDINGDGRADIIIGAPTTSPNGLSNAGSVYVYGLVATDLHEQKKNRRVNFGLTQNYPNPFNPTTVIRYYLPERDFVTLEVFNIIGQRIKVLAKEEQNAGEHDVIWNGHDETGNSLSSGIYFYRLKTKVFSEIKRMVFLK